MPNCVQTLHRAPSSGHSQDGYITISISLIGVLVNNLNYEGATVEVAVGTKSYKSKITTAADEDGHNLFEQIEIPLMESSQWLEIYISNESPRILLASKTIPLYLIWEATKCLTDEEREKKENIRELQSQLRKAMELGDEKTADEVKETLRKGDIGITLPLDKRLRLPLSKLDSNSSYQLRCDIEMTKAAARTCSQVAVPRVSDGDRPLVENFLANTPSHWFEDGFEIPLTYLTPRFLLATITEDSSEKVAEFVQVNHCAAHMVINTTKEPLQKQMHKVVNMLPNATGNYTLRRLIELLREIWTWQTDHAQNVVIVCCEEGSRSGVFLSACFLLASWQHETIGGVIDELRTRVPKPSMADFSLTHLCCLRYIDKIRHLRHLKAPLPVTRTITIRAVRAFLPKRYLKKYVEWTLTIIRSDGLVSELFGTVAPHKEEEEDMVVEFISLQTICLHEDTECRFEAINVRRSMRVTKCLDTVYFHTSYEQIHSKGSKHVIKLELSKKNAGIFHSLEVEIASCQIAKKLAYYELYQHHYEEVPEFTAQLVENYEAEPPPAYLESQDSFAMLSFGGPSLRDLESLYEHESMLYTTAPCRPSGLYVAPSQQWKTALEQEQSKAISRTQSCPPVLELEQRDEGVSASVMRGFWVERQDQHQPEPARKSPLAPPRNLQRNF